MNFLSKLFRVDVQRLKQRGDVDGVLKALGHQDFGIRVEAAQALGELGDKRTVEPLIAALKDAHSNVRAEAARALQNLADARAVDSLTAVMQKERGLVRIVAMRALGDLAGVRSVDAIIAVLDDKSFKHQSTWDEPGAAKEAITKIGRPAVPILIAARSQDGRVRGLIVELLGELGGDEAFEELIQKLRGWDPSDRYRAASALGRLGDARAIDALVSVLNDHESYVRKAAADALELRWAVEAKQPLDDHHRRVAEQRRDAEMAAKRKAEEEAEARRLAEPCYRCKKTDVRQKQGTRYWCSWCGDWADSNFATTKCDRCRKPFQYDTTRYARKPKAFCDECDAYYSGRIRDEFGGRSMGF